MPSTAPSATSLRTRKRREGARGIPVAAGTAVVVACVPIRCHEDIERCTPTCQSEECLCRDPKTMYAASRTSVPSSVPPRQSAFDSPAAIPTLTRVKTRAPRRQDLDTSDVPVHPGPPLAVSACLLLTYTPRDPRAVSCLAPVRDRLRDGGPLEEYDIWFHMAHARYVTAASCASTRRHLLVHLARARMDFDGLVEWRHPSRAMGRSGARVSYGGNHAVRDGADRGRIPSGFTLLLLAAGPRFP